MAINSKSQRILPLIIYSMKIQYFWEPTLFSVLVKSEYKRIIYISQNKDVATSRRFTPFYAFFRPQRICLKVFQRYSSYFLSGFNLFARSINCNS